METVKKIKYVIIAAGILISAAFYVLGQGGPGALYFDSEPAAAGVQETLAEAPVLPAAEEPPEPGTAAAVLSEEQLAAIEDAVRQAVREELMSAAEEGYLQEAGRQAALQAAEEASRRAGMVDLNRADREELMTLPGIGEKKAEDILRYREEHGGFQSTEELMKISGIKEAAFRRIQDKIYV